eukprot:2188472-Rhodomonas_salina.2
MPVPPYAMTTLRDASTSTTTLRYASTEHPTLCQYRALTIECPERRVGPSPGSSIAYLSSGHCEGSA